MKKIFSLLLALALIFSTFPALAEGADIRMENGRVTKAILSGQIKTDREILSIHV